ncbi:hypothetical protein TNCV_1944511 [Trichonephila clavipes]|nr:hypothetical protein TNCV_1944511 [Trichonephila clavipes]
MTNVHKDSRIVQKTRQEPYNHIEQLGRKGHICSRPPSICPYGEAVCSIVNCQQSDPYLGFLRQLGKILGEPTPLAANRKKRQATPTMAAREYSGIRWLRNENICKQ